MKGIACSGDTTTHQGVLQASQARVLVQGRPVVTVGDRLVCPMCDGNKPHGIAEVQGGGRKILVAGKAVACQDDCVRCGGAAMGRIQTGSGKVFLR